ncbi:monovalent cation/H+ antiporter complex subunit F [Roseomonas sp. OT10]|uniref:monovalent cation/H+ antiporter complex subunit F n=1 Tax=Roseomonas cutis TaxID=2897332 RepID=UPI001E3485B5|nr:monovalent cation/H+ antiporter complex subunit F [Roseomonas sp. OT10]UFN48574.1 monovalent cation/H+ antiporter complex subunit F [Roseomonas sp. OT10]
MPGADAGPAAMLLTGAAVLALLITFAGLWPLLRVGAAADRMMGMQLLGSGVIAALLLLDAAHAVPGVLDVALALALLAPFASVAFVLSGRRRPPG